MEQRIPCHCAVCKEQTTPHYFSRSYLDRAEQAQKPAQCGLSFEDINVRELLDGVFANEMGAKGSKLDKDTIVEWIELGELQKALEAMKSEYPDVSILIGNLKEAEKANQQGRLSFVKLAETKALLKFAALEMLKSKS